jgi:hypothetical protein
MSEGFYYLATPYTKYPDGIDAAYEMACRAAAECFREGLLVFSPMVHCHPIAKLSGMSGGYEFWKRYNEAMMAAAVGLMVVKMNGWEESAGIAAEIEWFMSHYRPVFYCDAPHGDEF